MRYFSSARALRAALAVAAIFTVMEARAAFAACDPEDCLSIEAPSGPAARGAVRVEDEPAPIVRTKRKARNSQARSRRSRTRAEARDSAAGIKEGADRNTPVIDFRAPTTPAPRAQIAPPAAPPPVTGLAAGHPMATTASAANAMASADTATAAAPEPPPAAAPPQIRANVAPPPAPAPDASPDSSTPSFWQIARTDVAELFASLGNFFNDSATTAPSDREASLMGRIFVGLAGLLTVASALRFVIF